MSSVFAACLEVDLKRRRSGGALQSVKRRGAVRGIDDVQLTVMRGCSGRGPLSGGDSWRMRWERKAFAQALEVRALKMRMVFDSGFKILRVYMTRVLYSGDGGENS